MRDAAGVGEPLIDPGPGAGAGVGAAKAGLRARALQSRRARSLSAPDNARSAAHLAPLLREVATVAGYVPLPDEPAPGPLAPCRLLLLPRLLVGGDLAWVPAGPPRRGRRGTVEPDGEPVVGGLARADLVVVPALLVDHRGVRLGRGGGSYDRALPLRRPGVLAVALLADDEELVRELPREAHDAAIDAVCLPSGLVYLETRPGRDTVAGPGWPTA